MAEGGEVPLEVSTYSGYRDSILAGEGQSSSAESFLDVAKHHRAHRVIPICLNLFGMAAALISRMKNRKLKSKPSKSRISSVSVSEVDDLIKAIKDDHKDLKKFIEVMKDDEARFLEKKEATKEFVSLLKSHAPSEEKALYQLCLRASELRMMADEGYIEHGVAANLMKTMPKSSDRDRWGAQVKVLAELVEHHIEEEESEFLPQVEKIFGEKKKEKMAQKFYKLRKNSQRHVTSENSGVLGTLQN